jgi:hypothetical protein
VPGFSRFLEPFRPRDLGSGPSFNWTSPTTERYRPPVEVESPPSTRPRWCAFLANGNEADGRRRDRPRRIRSQQRRRCRHDRVAKLRAIEHMWRVAAAVSCATAETSFARPPGEARLIREWRGQTRRSSFSRAASRAEYPRPCYRTLGCGMVQGEETLAIEVTDKIGRTQLERFSDLRHKTELNLPQQGKQTEECRLHMCNRPIRKPVRPA